MASLLKWTYEVDHIFSIETVKLKVKQLYNNSFVHLFSHDFFDLLKRQKLCQSLVKEMKQ